MTEQDTRAEGISVLLAEKQSLELQSLLLTQEFNKVREQFFKEVSRISQQQHAILEKIIAVDNSIERCLTTFMEGENHVYKENQFYPGVRTGRLLHHAV